MTATQHQGAVFAAAMERTIDGMTETVVVGANLKIVVEVTTNLAGVVMETITSSAAGAMIRMETMRVTAVAMRDQCHGAVPPKPMARTKRCEPTVEWPIREVPNPPRSST